MRGRVSPGWRPTIRARAGLTPQAIRLSLKTHRAVEVVCRGELGGTRRQLGGALQQVGDRAVWGCVMHRLYQIIPDLSSAGDRAKVYDRRGECDGALNRLRQAASALPSSADRSRPIATSPEVTVRVVADTHLFTTDDGSTLWCGGHTPVDDEGFYLSIGEHRTSDARCLYCNVAGTSYRRDAFRMRASRPARPSSCVPSPQPPRPQRCERVG